MALVGSAARVGQVVNLLFASDEMTGDFSIQSLSVSNTHATLGGTVVLSNTAGNNLFTFHVAALSSNPPLTFPDLLHCPAGFKLESVSAGTMSVTFVLSGRPVIEP